MLQVRSASHTSFRHSRHSRYLHWEPGNTFQRICMNWNCCLHGISEVLGVAACESPSHSAVFFLLASPIANPGLSPCKLDIDSFDNRGDKLTTSTTLKSAVHYSSPTRAKILFRNTVIYWWKIPCNKPKAFSFYPVVCHNSRDPFVAPKYVVFQFLGASTHAERLLIESKQLEIKFALPHQIS